MIANFLPLVGNDVCLLMLILDGLFYIATLFVIVKLPRDFLMHMLSFRDFTLFSDIFCNMSDQYEVNYHEILSEIVQSDHFIRNIFHRSTLVKLCIIELCF